MLYQFRALPRADYASLVFDDEGWRPTVPAAALDALPTTVSDEPAHRAGACAICNERFERGATLVELPCAHEFHQACIIEWLGRCSVRCPCDGQPVYASDDPPGPARASGRPPGETVGTAFAVSVRTVRSGVRPEHES